MTYLSKSRRNFLKTLSTSTLLSTSAIPVLATTLDENREDYKPSANDKEETDILQERIQYLSMVIYRFQISQIP